MTDRTVRDDGNGASAGRTVREGLTAEGTVREGTGSGTLREDSGSPVREGDSGRAWLPAALAARFEVVEELPTRGMEADILVVADENGCRFVAKIYRRGIKPKEEILRILKQARFEHIVRLEEFGEENGTYWELIEYIANSSLRALIDQEGPKLPDATVRQILRELNDALAHLHGLPIEHRDLKPDNVLVRTREPVDLVLADFGIASLMDASVRETSAHRTISYAPPEAIGAFTDVDDKSRRNVAVVRTRWDYWSLGIILVEILTGEHPFKGRSEAVIAHRLATQNVDDLVEGIEKEGWRKLCRGLLRRDPRKRWGSEQVSLWLANERDHRLVVEDEVAPTEQNVRGIDFDGRAFTTPDSLGLALSQDWTKAKSLLERRQKEVETWLFDKLGRQDLGQALQEIDKDARLSLDARTFFKIYLLAPSAPLRFRDMDLSPANIENIAKRAASGDREAGVALLAIHESGILRRSVKLEQGKGLAKVERDWQAAVNDYRSKLQDVERNGARAPALEGDTLVKLLAAALPVSSVVTELRAAAQRAATSDARQCPWFRDLGDPDKATVGALMVMPHVVREAEAGARRRRYEAALENYGVPARFLLGSAGGLVGGIATAFVPGFIIYWPIVWIWGEKSATTIALLWIIGCALVAGFSKWVNLIRLVGNQGQDHAEVRAKGIFYSMAGAAVIAAVLVFGVSEISSKYQRFSQEAAETNRIASLSGQIVTHTLNSSTPATAFQSTVDGIVMRATISGDLDPSDEVQFLVTYPNCSAQRCDTMDCPSLSCVINKFRFAATQDSLVFGPGSEERIAYPRGTYRIILRVGGRTLASTNFRVSN